MIQRIQSFYLLLITILLIAVLFLPLGVFITASGLYEFTAFSVREAGVSGAENLPLWVLGSLSALSATMSFLAIFMFKKRKVQIRICLINALLLVGFYLLFAGFTYIAAGSLKTGFGLRFGLTLPLIAIILDLLAIRAIRKDEALVRSLDRIR